MGLDGVESFHGSCYYSQVFLCAFVFLLSRMGGLLFCQDEVLLF